MAVDAAAALIAEAPPEDDFRPPSPVISPPSPLPAGPGGRPRRRIRLPQRFRDDVPPPPPPVDLPEEPAAPVIELDETSSTRKWVKTDPTDFGLYKVFPNRPTHDPDESVSLDDLCKSSELLVAAKPSSSAATPPWSPFMNSTVARLMTWFHLGSNLKSIADLDSLVHNVLLKEDFDPAHLKDFSTARENKRLDDSAPNSGADDSPAPPDGWKTASIKIKLPAPKVCVAEADAAEFEVEGLIYRPLLDVMVEAFQGPAFKDFHTTPFEYRWDPNHNKPDNPDVELTAADADLDEYGLPELPDGHEVVYGEIYTSSRMLKAHNELPQTATPNLETIIAAYMFWSDATHLANFGNASLWPLYTFFGNLSKYTRAKPTANAGYHQAYFPSLPDLVKDFYRNKFGVAPSADVFAHLKRELMHAIWDLLLCPEFIHAYIHGLVVKCGDGIERRIFPRFFTYGADYPEKVLLATIKYFGGCPCPRCFVEKDQIHKMGTKADMRQRQKIRQVTPWYTRMINTTRRWIFEKGVLVAGAAVNKVLKAQSWVPTRNAFTKLPSFNFFTMFVPDLLHEVELGGWKSLFIHLLRILQAYNPITIEKLDERFRKIPTFGRSTIRRFHANVSAMKKLAARDFEDILQCAIPVFEGLLPEPHNTIVLSLLFTVATWHAYAKLRLHSSRTIKIFRMVTTELGAQARNFVGTTCKIYVTHELPQEENRRIRRQAQKNSTRKTAPTTSSKKRKAWNINTYKWHSLGDYPDTVVDVGTTDSYSTQIGEQRHIEPKALYKKTNKRRFEWQIACHERRRRLLHAIKRRMDGESRPLTEDEVSPQAQTKEHRVKNSLAPANDLLPRTPPRQHHHISESKRTWLHALDLPDDFPDDPALENFLPELKSHLLGRLLGIPYDGDENQFSIQDLADVNILRERLYTHKLMRVNYTTYDVRRDQDTLNTRTHPDFMVLAREEEEEATAHPYWYGRIVGIFHAEVRHVGPKSKDTMKTHRMEFLWVRWFGRDMEHSAGWKAKRLHRIRFLHASNPGAFGFIDPSEVIRGVHLIPAFHYGRTSDLLPPSITRHFEGEDHEDYCWHYVNQFVDRDMFMRYTGDAIGHRIAPTMAPAEPAQQNVSGDDDEMDIDPVEPPAESPQDLEEPEADDDVESGSDSNSSDSSESSDEESDEQEENAGEELGENGIEPTDEDLIEFAGFDEL
ncbi:hypothetical protein C8F04DRAFT_1313789 [Mycena alexandri]|uniref:Uncharacterized protein n=1 Tax=Mycena alexandri TaxID=1745969 RepID=A0AAD6WUK4_9AGAR|nr:hypothetical protein C8F04DRAFT_1313789 [Mycena alexandri]